MENPGNKTNTINKIERVSFLLDKKEGETPKLVNDEGKN